MIFRWIRIHWIALRHFAGETSREMYAEEIRHPEADAESLLDLMHLRWLGGLYWGEINEDYRKDGVT